MGYAMSETVYEPFDNNADGSRKDIKKGIIALTHVDGYKYGTNFFNVDFLASDHNDPSGGIDGNAGAFFARIEFAGFAAERWRRTRRPRSAVRRDQPDRQWPASGCSARSPKSAARTDRPWRCQWGARRTAGRTLRA